MTKVYIFTFVAFRIYIKVKLESFPYFTLLSAKPFLHIKKCENLLDH